ncbi:MAG: electron transport complex subunit RsxE [Thermodesulfovibrionales bacterium]|nr:electron transport complex subunit RsxE [Thermodesulfovibrionales bacterium]
MSQLGKISYRELVLNGIFKENTIFKLALSLCPSIAVTNNVRNGVLMGAAVLFVQVMVNITISLMRNLIHPRIRLPIFMLVISGWVTVTDMSMAAFAPAAYKQMGLYIQLIVAFASILARAEMFASKNTFVPSMFDGIGMGAGFLLALTVISFFRELLGKGSLWGYQIINAKPLLILVLPAGGFFAVGLLMGLFNWISMKYEGRQ